MYDQFNATVKVAWFKILPFFSQTHEQLSAQGITPTAAEAAQEQRAMDFKNPGVNTVVLTPGSDPRRGTGPSLVANNEILRHVSPYYLTQTFDSAPFIHAQNPNGKGFSYTYQRARSNRSLLYRNFKWNMLFYPQKLVATVGNLVHYNSVEYIGHFPVLGSPPALADDIRLIGKHLNLAWLLWQGLARLVSRDCDGLTAPCVYHDTPSVASVETGGFLVAYTIHGDQQNAFDYTSDFLATILGRQQIYTLGTGLGVPPNPTISSGSDASNLNIFVELPADQTSYSPTFDGNNAKDLLSKLGGTIDADAFYRYDLIS
ncbi:hypothetical protein FP744_10006465 [Trichoderma asperellum]